MFKIEDFRFSSSSIDDFYTPIKPTRLASSRIRIASAADLNGFIRVSSNKLVRVSQNDFWKLAKDDETGEYFIERLTDGDDPITE